MPWKYWKPEKSNPYRYPEKCYARKDNDIHKVDPKYDNFKEEILHYDELKSNAFEKEILPKAKQYVETKVARSLRVWQCESLGNVREGDHFKLPHIISLIFYCDYSKLCTEFGKSFRKINKYELKSEIKRRNEKYFHFSRVLRETVYCFGQSAGKYKH